MIKQLNKLTKCMMVFAILVMATSPINANFDTKLQMEKDYAERIQTALDRIYKKGNFVVKVDVNLGKEAVIVKYTEQSNAPLNKNQKGEKVFLLPGYPAIKNISPEAMTQLPFDHKVTYQPPAINKITVDLYVRKSFSKSEARKAAVFVKELINMKDNRGDKVNTVFKKFLKGAGPSNVTQNMIVHQGKEKLISLSNFFNFLFVLLVIGFIVIYVLFQIRQTSAAKGGGGGDTPNISVNPNIELPGDEGDSSEINISNQPSIKKYFNFINKSNIDNLIYVIQNEKISLENVQIIFSFLNGAVAAKLLDSFDLKQQAILAVNLLKQDMMNRATLEKLETKIQNALECLVGGTKPFTDTFNNVTNDKKKQLLELLGKSNPKGYKEFRNNIIIFDDLKELDDDELKKVLSEVSVEVLSVSLISVNPDTQNKIQENLTKSAKDMLTQFLKLKGSNVMPEEVEIAQSKILSVVSKLEKEGKIELLNKIKLK